MSEDYAGQHEAAARAVADLIEDLDPGAFVNSFILAVEVLDSGSRRAAWMFSPKGQAPWQTLGLAAHIIQVEQATTIQREADA